MDKLREVQQYWDQYPIVMRGLDKLWGSRDFFQQYKESRDKNYAPYVHSDKLLNFRAYEGKSVLDLGCGIGLDALEFAKHGARVTAIDISPTCIGLAKEYFKYHDLHATIEVGNGEQLRFNDQTFDVVISLGVLYYTPNTQKAIDEMHRVLKPGGQAFVMFCNKYSWYVLLAKISGTNLEHEEKDPPIYKLYSVREIQKMFKNFSKVETILDRFPCKTIKRSGIIAELYNHIFVPFIKFVPKAIMQPFGFHIIVKAIK